MEDDVEIAALSGYPEDGRMCAYATASPRQLASSSLGSEQMKRLSERLLVGRSLLPIADETR